MPTGFCMYVAKETGVWCLINLARLNVQSHIKHLSLDRIRKSHIDFNFNEIYYHI